MVPSSVANLLWQLAELSWANTVTATPTSAPPAAAAEQQQQQADSEQF